MQRSKGEYDAYHIEQQNLTSHSGNACDLVRCCCVAIHTATGYPYHQKAFVPERGGAARAPETDGLTRGIFLVTTFVWDVEGAVLNAARTYGLTEVIVASDVQDRRKR